MSEWRNARRVQFGWEVLGLLTTKQILAIVLELRQLGPPGLPDLAVLFEELREFLSLFLL